MPYPTEAEIDAISMDLMFEPLTEQEFTSAFMQATEQLRGVSAEIAAAQERWECRYAEGRAAYARGLTRRDCPHPLYTRDRTGWLHGFVTCLPPGPEIYSGPDPTQRGRRGSRWGW